VAVVLAILDSANEQALCWLRQLRASESLPTVLVIGQLDWHALVALVESGVCTVLHRAEAIGDGWRARSAQPRMGTAICHPNWCGT
jgi:hypothetical protein